MIDELRRGERLGRAERRRGEAHGAVVVRRIRPLARVRGAEDEDEDERDERDAPDESPEFGPMQTGAEGAYHGVILTALRRSARG